MALTELFYDTFTDTSGTLLTAHTPNTGLSWTSLAGNVAANAHIGSDGTAVQPFHANTGDNYFTANTSQTETLHQRVDAVHGTALTRICLRLTNGSSAANGIRIDFNTALNKVFVYTVTNGTETQIASSYSVISIPSGAVCVATITEANALTVTVNGTLIDWSVGVTQLTVSGHDAGKFGWMGRKSYTTGGIDSFRGYYDVVAGQVPQGTASITTITPGETTASVEFTYSDSDATEYDLYIDGVYESTTASSPATASDLTASTTYTATIVPVNATGDGVSSAGVQFTTNAPAAQVPQGTVTIGSITVGETTATVPYTYNAADQTGFEYRLNGGTAIADAASPVDLTGLTADTAYTIEVRAVNATGAGAWSTAANFTTDAAPVADPIYTSGILYDNNKQPMVSLLLAHGTLYDPVSGQLVLRAINPTTNAEGRLVFQGPELTQGQEYDLNAETVDGQRIMPRGVAI